MDSSELAGQLRLCDLHWSTYYAGQHNFADQHWLINIIKNYGD